jgi:hypothetical protein
MNIDFPKKKNQFSFSHVNGRHIPSRTSFQNLWTILEIEISNSKNSRTNFPNLWTNLEIEDSKSKNSRSQYSKMWKPRMWDLKMWESRSQYSKMWNRKCEIRDLNIRKCGIWNRSIRKCENRNLKYSEPKVYSREKPSRKLNVQMWGEGIDFFRRESIFNSHGFEGIQYCISGRNQIFELRAKADKTKQQNLWKTKTMPLNWDQFWSSEFCENFGENQEFIFISIQ